MGKPASHGLVPAPRIPDALTGCLEFVGSPQCLDIIPRSLPAYTSYHKVESMDKLVCEGIKGYAC